MNLGLLKEFVRLKKKIFNTPIHEFRKIRKNSIEAEKMGILPNYHPKLTVHLCAWDVYNKIFQMGNNQTCSAFLFEWNKLKTDKNILKWSRTKNWIKSFKNSLPICGLTAKNYQKFWKKLCQGWRGMIRKDRMILEDQKKDFSKAKYVILKNPNNMNKFNKKELRKYLKIFPNLREIREAVRKFHYQFKAPPHYQPSLNFLQKLVKKDSHQKLKAAIQTLVNQQEYIFAYRSILAQHPNLKKGKSIRSNREEIYHLVNNVVRTQFGFRSIPGARIRIEGILSCLVIISKKLLS
ncbi:MAG: transposase [Promethearchaeota archaeon]